MEYYGVQQYNHGAEYIWVFTKEQLQADFDYYRFDYYPLGNESFEIDFYPIGGFDSSCSSVTPIANEKEALLFLKQEAVGPDYYNPKLIDMAEYCYQIETDKGCAGEILEKYGIYKEELEEKATFKIDQAIDFIKDTLNIKISDFYNNPYRNLTVLDVNRIAKLKQELENCIFDKIDFSKDEVSVMLQLSEKLSKRLLRQNGYYEPETLNKPVYLKINIDNETATNDWKVVDNAGNNLDYLSAEKENNDIVKDYINQFIETKISEKRTDYELKQSDKEIEKEY